MVFRSASLLALLAAACAQAAGQADPPRAGPPSRAAVEIERSRVTFQVDRQLTSRYHSGPDLAKPYFWPLQAPGGTFVTRPWPQAPRDPGGSVDHPHQKSAWFCHGDVIPEGIPIPHRNKDVKGVDFWSEGPGHGRIVCTAVDPLTAVREYVGVLTRNDWKTADGVTILQETRRIELHPLDQANLYVLDIDLHASRAPITFGDTKEGSLGVRVRDSMTEKPGHGRITNADGKTGEAACWGRISAWCDYSGPSDDHTVGIALLADPANPYPTCWHVRSYGLLAANPFGRDKSGFPAMKGKTDLVHLDRGQHLHLRYGILVHAGDVSAGKVAQHYRYFTRQGRPAQDTAP